MEFSTRQVSLLASWLSWPQSAPTTECSSPWALPAQSNEPLPPLVLVPEEQLSTPGSLGGDPTSASMSRLEFRLEAGHCGVRLSTRSHRTRCREMAVEITRG